MRRIILIYIFYITSSFAFSQNWMSVGLGAYNYGVTKLYSDTINNTLYAAGNFKVGTSDTIKGIAKWNGIQWDSLGSGLNQAYCETITNYNGELYVGGGFSKAGGIPAQGIAKWNGLSWDSVSHGSNIWIYDFHQYNKELYIGGMFAPVDTTNSRAIAKRNGNAWYSVGNPIWTLTQIKSIQNFNGDIYAAGFFESNSNHILKWDGNNWDAVGNGIDNFGSIDSPVNDMIVFNGELYIAGNFIKNANAGNYIMKWDGINFSDVGGGMNGEIRSLCIFHNELYAVGAFTSAGGVVAKNIAKWDGTNWCGLGSTFNGSINTIEVFNDELYIGGGFSQIDSQNINYIAKWIGGNFVSTCGNAISVNEIYVYDNIKIYPNPTTSIINIVDENNQLQNATIQIKNYLGQLVYTSSYTSQINLSSLSAGMYFLTIQDKDSKKIMKIIKQ
ncbi:MAG: T9SS type A sorting domain-containing protein [Bacteroidia bacterium]|nr:T9SS type A sorting domain-containing protein [Bacteroidia bacterium]